MRRPLVGIWVKLLRIPRAYLYSGILLVAALGSYSIGASTVDLVLLFCLGLLGWAMRSFGMPIAPAVIGLILGPLAEEQLRRTLAISQGDLTALVRSPFAVVAYSLLIVLFVVGQWIKRREARIERELAAMLGEGTRAPASPGR